MSGVGSLCEPCLGEGDCGMFNCLFMRAICDVCVSVCDCTRTEWMGVGENWVCGPVRAAVRFFELMEITK